MDYKAGKNRRVTRRKDIRRIFEEGRRARDRSVTILAAPNGLDYCRAAVGVSKAHGNAVRRNRLKRLCREAFRLSRDCLPAGWDYVIIPRGGGRFTLAGLRASVEALGPRVAAGGAAEGRP